MLPEKNDVSQRCNRIFGRANRVLGSFLLPSSSVAFSCHHLSANKWPPSLAWSVERCQLPQCVLGRRSSLVYFKVRKWVVATILVPFVEAKMFIWSFWTNVGVSSELQTTLGLYVWGDLVIQWGELPILCLVWPVLLGAELRNSKIDKFS